MVFFGLTGHRNHVGAIHLRFDSFFLFENSSKHAGAFAGQPDHVFNRKERNLQGTMETDQAADQSARVLLLH